MPAPQEHHQDIPPIDICTQCYEKFWTREDAKEHRVKHRKQPPSSKKKKPVNPNPPKLFKCEIPSCGAEFRSDDSLQNHIRRTHTRVRSIPCPFVTELSCSDMFHASYQAHAHMQVAHYEYLYHCASCLETEDTSRDARKKARKGWLNKEKFTRHQHRDHPYGDFDQLLVRPTRLLPSELNQPSGERPANYFPWPDPGGARRDKFRPLQPSQLSPSGNAGASSNADEIDEFKALDRMDVDEDYDAPPIQAVTTSSSLRGGLLPPPGLSAAFASESTAMGPSRLSPFVVEEASTQRSRAATLPGFQASEPNAGLRTLPASRLHGFTYVPQSGTPSPQLRMSISPAPTAQNPSPVFGMPPPISTNSGIMRRSDSETGFLTIPQIETREPSFSRPRSNTAPNASLGISPLPPLVPGGTIPPLRMPPSMEANNSANKHFPFSRESSQTPGSVRADTPGGWSTSSNDAGDGSSMMRGRSSSSSSWTDPPNGLSGSLTRWTMPNQKGTYPAEIPDNVSAIGESLYIPPIRQFASSSSDSFMDVEGPSSAAEDLSEFDSTDWPQSAAPDERRIPRWFMHRRTNPNT